MGTLERWAFVFEFYPNTFANKSGVKKVVMVMCFDDCPEETQWVYDNAQKVDLIIGIVAGLDLTKHEKLLKYINEFRTNFKRCMFGSDWPVCRLATNADYDDVLQLLQEATKHLSFEEKKAIFRENAIKYYGLDE